MNCLFCGRETDNPKFCSKSHAASFNNPRKPSRKKVKEKKIIIRKEPSLTSKI